MRSAHCRSVAAGPARGAPRSAGLRATSRGVCGDGYVLDFGELKRAGRAVCKELHHSFIVPAQSDVLAISTAAARGRGEDVGSGDGTEMLCIECQDGSAFSLPKADCSIVPIVHSTAEEIAFYIWCRVVEDISLTTLLARRVLSLDVIVAEMPNQEAVVSLPLPATVEDFNRLKAARPPVTVKGCTEKDTEV